MTKTQKPCFYCAAARALEVIGEKWSLLVVRDLLRGPKRFSDLLRSLDGVTPKLLTQRLRDLESSGVLERNEEAGRREVWYRLTPAGLALRPVIQELLIWGVEYARMPEETDLVNPDRVGYGTMAVLNRRGVFPARRTVLEISIPGRGSTTILFDGVRWSVPADELQAEPDVRAIASLEAWISALRPQERFEFEPKVRFEGASDAVAEIRGLLLARNADEARI